MRIVFMGTPDFAAQSLKKLIDEKYDIAAVFTQPDKPRNRGMQLSFSPVKQLALDNNIPVYQPAKLRDGTATELVKSLRPRTAAPAAPPLAEAGADACDRSIVRPG